MAHKAIGDILDQLGVTADLDDGDLVSSAVVVLAILIERITSEPPDLSGDDD